MYTHHCVWINWITLLLTNTWTFQTVQFLPIWCLLINYGPPPLGVQQFLGSSNLSLGKHVLNMCNEDVGEQVVSAQGTNGKSGQTLADPSCRTKTGSGEGFLNLSIVHIRGLRVLCMGGCLVHCMFSRIPGLYLLDASNSPHQVLTKKNVPKHCHVLQ